MLRNFVLSVVLATTCLTLSPEASEAAGWRAGTARVDVTPKTSLWMAGYGSRDRPSEGSIQPLWAKALVLEDPEGRKALMVTLDVCGIDRALSKTIRDEVASRHKIPYERMVLACSHTHSGPVLGDNLITMYKIDEDQAKAIREYTRSFVAMVREIVDKAASNLEPVQVSWETGEADFAVNRRENVEANVPRLREAVALKGPVDHDVPVLRVKTPRGEVKAVVFGYACHCTVLSGYQFCGDYAGFAQAALEERDPGTQAMFVAGCGADQNPLPRRTVALAESYGRALAKAVGRVLESPMRPVDAPLHGVYEEIPLRLGAIPDRAHWEAEAKSSTHPVANRARMLLGELDRKGAIDTTYPYPVQSWKIGELTWIFLGGEVVVDYSLRFKRNLGSSTTWVSAYCNDEMAYSPTLRVLKEGGYEGATSMVYYGLPTSWSEDVEDQIVEAVRGVLSR
ncbi:MAG: neutral/alkaline non-lysosomal ceramidase N-terminal domain-containing protein [Isosphaeraceae bacterium]